MARIQNLLMAFGDKSDRSAVLTLKFFEQTHEYQINVFYYSDFGSITTLITSTFNYRLALEAFQKNLVALEADDYQISVMEGSTNKFHVLKSKTQDTHNELEIF